MKITYSLSSEMRLLNKQYMVEVHFLRNGQKIENTEICEKCDVATELKTAI